MGGESPPFYKEENENNFNNDFYVRVFISTNQGNR